MKKSFLFSIVFIIFGSLLAACGGDKDANNSGEVTDAVELEMYSWRTEDKGAYEEIIKKFEEENPDIKVNFKPYESTEYNTILTNALVSGSGPDIAQLRPYSGSKTIADNDYLISLDDLDGLDNFNDDYLDAASGSDGSVYGVPLTLNTGVVFYNKNIFEEHNIEVPETWEEFIEASKQLKEAGITPIAQGGRDAYLLSMLHGVISPTAYNGDEFVEDLENDKADLTDERMKKTLDRMDEIADYLPEDFVALDDNDAQALFYAEEAAMYINGDYRLETFKDNIPDTPIGIIPGFKDSEDDDPMVMSWVDSSYGVVKDTEHEEEAMKFMEFLASQEFGEAFSKELSRASAIEGVEVEDELVQQVIEASEKSSTPYLMLVYYGEGSPSTKTVFEDDMQGYYLDKITKEELLEEIQENAEKAEEEGVKDLEDELED